MKKIISALALLILMSGAALALSDAEYLKMKRNSQSFARADRKLTNVWNKLKKSLPDYVFSELQKNQREWIRKGRDDKAKEYIKEGYSRTEAYTMATNDRANALPALADDYLEDGMTEPGFPIDEPVRKPAPQKKVNDDVDDDDNKGEIEEERFSKDSESDEIIYEGNYTRRNAGNRGAFMTVLITDKNDMEAEVTISLQNPEVTWSARGWITDNVLELYDEEFPNCTANLTFSKGRVKIETSPEDDWDNALDENVRLDGIYDRNNY